ncbi:MAG: hypothetical protein HYS07_06945 [Chlamydiae bacterium]|nr:hypothetical protein [Chlamydiota bacterium]MBI3277519.1 hypothetical protein [Chlamydiota bacterium]
MHSIRFNLTLPQDIAEILKGKKNKSSFIAHLLKEKAMEEKRRKLFYKLREGYRTTRQEDLLINKEWESTLGDGLDSEG